MKNNNLLLSTLFIAATALLIYHCNSLTFTIFISILLIIIINFQYKLIKLLLLLAIPFIVYFSLDAYQLHLQKNQLDISNKEICGLILPDTIAIDGDKLRCHLKQDNDGQTIRVFKTLENKSEKRHWQKIAQTIHVEAVGDFKRIPCATNFSQFDLQTHYDNKHITHQIDVKSIRIMVAQPKNCIEVFCWHIRQWHCLGIMNASRLPNPLGEYTQSIIFGTTPVSFYDHNPGVQVLGLIHLFSVSGFHVNYVLRFIKGFLRRLYVPKEIVAGISMFVLFCYFIFAGEQAVLARAIISGFLRMTNLMGFKRIKAMNTWSISLLGSLIYEPCILLTLGGQLSFAMTFCLLFSRHINFWQTNCLLSIVSMPLILSQQYHWHILQTFVNFAAIPIFSVLIVPAAIIGFLGQSFCSIVETMNMVISLFTSSLNALSQFPGNIVFGRMHWLSASILFITAVMLFDREKKITKYARNVWLFNLMISFAIIHLPFNGEFTTFDIGQGDAALIREPFNKSVSLIDTGGKLSFVQKKDWQKNQVDYNSGEQVVVRYLHSLGIHKINNLVLTHQDFDHIGNAKYILKHIRVENVVIPKGMESQLAFKREILPYIRNAKVHEVTAGDKIPKLPLKVLHPFNNGVGENEDSIALYGRVGGKYILTAGDLDQNGEKAISEYYPNLVVNILKLGHHGSKTSTNPETIKKWQPQYGIISAGRQNRYNHPHQETISTCQENRIFCFNTQTHGMIKYIYYKEKGHFEVKLVHELKPTSATN
ncbi:DNA internalization-related competence protein ComEC/Rec2 [Leuconostoc palmae]|uniref:DNA internalization-related competence protein ComEC/Rec2 n=1 Tax=Leuconostoc palmae TaxID=501487 RepID=UPI001C7DF43A|nr:DNA internalization-related competence protein ComEC/Rec2 [Leuconostoc palmae]